MPDEPRDAATPPQPGSGGPAESGVDEDADGEARESRQSSAPLRPGHWVIDADGHPWIVVGIKGDLAVVEGRSTRETVALGADGRIADDNRRGFGDPVEGLLPEALDEFFPPPDSWA